MTIVMGYARQTERWAGYLPGERSIDSWIRTLCEMKVSQDRGKRVQLGSNPKKSPMQNPSMYEYLLQTLAVQRRALSASHDLRKWSEGGPGCSIGKWERQWMRYDYLHDFYLSMPEAVKSKGEVIPSRKFNSQEDGEEKEQETIDA